MQWKDEEKREIKVNEIPIRKVHRYRPDTSMIYSAAQAARCSE